MTAVLRLVLATANPDKAAEIRAVLGGSGVELLPRPADLPDVAETGETLEENARPRWDRACFSSGAISAKVRPSPSLGMNTGS